jgi:hypothetical protein
LGILLAIAGGTGAQAPAPVDFNRDIRPILADRCFQCHGPDAAHRKADLRLDEEGSTKAKALVVGKPEESPLYQRITTTDPEEVMPPPGAGPKPVSAEEAALIHRWITEGAPWASHWAFAPVQRPAVPAKPQADWGHNEIDAFTAARLAAEGLTPAPEADRATLLRRASFDLVGLPPTLTEMDAFLADTSPQAFEKAVDRLLASPHYGERMAVDWLDGARYADTNGFQNDFQRTMWPWRDWVIAAFNENMPYDQFTVEQIAGDLLPSASESQRIATGFNRNNRANTEGGSIEEEWRIENLVDRVDATSSVFLGLSMGCARCHDHKYDPVTQKEFYKFLAFFNSTEDRGFYEETRGNTGPLVRLPTFENQARLTEFDAGIAKARATLQAAEANTESNFTAWKQALPAAGRPTVGRTLQLHVPLRGDLVALEPAAGVTAQYPAGTPVWAEGLLGPALVLDGTPDSHVDLGTPLAFELDKPFTISVWVKPETHGALFSKMDDAAAYRGVDVLITEAGEIGVHLVHQWPDNAIRITTNEKIPFNAWSEVSVTYDGQRKPEGIKVYLAGRATGQRVDTAGLNGSIHTEQPVRLGRRSSGLHLKGSVAELQVFNRSLSMQKLAELADHTLGRTLTATLNPERDALLRDFFLRRGDTQVVEARAVIEALEKEKADYLTNEVPSTMVMQETAEPRPTYRLNRGQYDAPDMSEPLFPAIPAFLPPLPQGVPNNRLGLARWLVDPGNPLTARVAVNRLWTKFFGRGLVKTPENFGVQAGAPSHPELLDWLAAEFQEGGWDLKALQKKIVLSATYRQHSAVGPDLLAKDPENTLLARGPRLRLQAELLRDNALAVSGLLAPKIGGPSVMPYQPAGLWDELAGGAGQGPYVQGTGEDLYRRSLYTYRKRTVPHPTLTSFDAPGWDICTVKRATTNTPLQALALLNDPTYVDAARSLAQRMLREVPGDAAQQLRHGFRLATGRYPSPTEAETLAAGLEGYRATFAAAPEECDAYLSNGSAPVDPSLDRVQVAAYAAVATVILNLDETISKE